jgi:hypothetical protein
MYGFKTGFSKEIVANCIGSQSENWIYLVLLGYRSIDNTKINCRVAPNF